jgi:hypothetical protein
MKTLVLFLSLLAVSLAGAVGAAACNKSISITDFDTSCQKASDCIAVYIGPPACCSEPNAAINASEQAKYEAEVAAEGSGSVCNVACVELPMPAPVCSAGTCELGSADSGAPDSGATD